MGNGCDTHVYDERVHTCIPSSSSLGMASDELDWPAKCYKL